MKERGEEPDEPQQLDPEVKLQRNKAKIEKIKAKKMEA